MEISLAKGSHIKAIEHCAKLAYTPYIKRMGRTPAPMRANYTKLINDRCIYLALLQTTIVGFIVFYPRKNAVHIENVAINPDYAGNGYGKQLINYAEQHAVNHSYIAIELYTNEAMIENIEMYAKLGYDEIERKEQEGFKRVFFRKQLL